MRYLGDSSTTKPDFREISVAGVIQPKGVSRHFPHMFLLWVIVIAFRGYHHFFILKMEKACRYLDDIYGKPFLEFSSCESKGYGLFLPRMRTKRSVPSGEVLFADSMKPRSRYIFIALSRSGFPELLVSIITE